MNLKGKIRQRMRRYLAACIFGMAYLGVMLGLEFGTALVPLWLAVAIMAWLAAVLAYNMHGYLKLRAILRSPYFYLVALQHDLGQGGEDTVAS